MNTAIIHDTYLHEGGAEQVLKRLTKNFPSADIYIPLISFRYKISLQKITKGKIKTSLFSYFPYVNKYQSILKPLLYIYWKLLNLKKYDLVISSSHSFSSKSVNVRKKTKHISYIHTPPRYLHGINNESKWIHNPMLKPMLFILRKIDIRDAKKPDLLIANSKNVQNRIKNNYHRKSLVVYPPIKIPKKINAKKEDYYIFLGRLTPQKGADLAIRTFNKLNKKLIVIGTGKEENKLKKLAGKTITFTGFISENQKIDIMKKAKAMINCSIDEDFGMAPVEALACGTPIIAYYSGGLKEILSPNKTGLFFRKYSAESLTKAIKKFEKIKIDSKVCHQTAKKYSETIFDKKINSTVNDYLG